MKSAWRVFRNETVKMARLKMAYLGPVCIAAVTFIFALNLKRFSDAISDNGWSMLVQTAQLNVTGVIPIFLLIYAASLVASETDHGTIRFSMTRPVSRFSFIMGKTMAAWLYLAVLMTAAVASGIGAGAYHGSFGPIAVFGEEAYSVGQATVQIGFCLVLAAIPLGAVALFGVTVSVFARTLLGAICFAIGAWISLFFCQEFLVDFVYIGDFDLADLIVTRGLDIPLRVGEQIASGADWPWDQPGLTVTLISSAVWSAFFLLLSAIRFGVLDLNRR